MKLAGTFLIAAMAVAAAPAMGADITIKFRAVSASGVGKEIGKIRAVDTKGGLRLVPRLSGLKPGAHGFHVHQNPKCGSKGVGGKKGAGVAAGGHYDPVKSGSHMGPKGKGHLGDLPKLMVDASGTAKKSMIAPRLKVADLWGRAIVIHAAGDNYSDNPKSLGGGGARVACATIVKAKKRMKKM
jgi:superoxide dismutase, Cu-Zn family